MPSENGKNGGKVDPFDRLLSEIERESARIVKAAPEMTPDKLAKELGKVVLPLVFDVCSQAAARVQRAEDAIDDLSAELDEIEAEDGGLEKEDAAKFRALFDTYLQICDATLAQPGIPPETAEQMQTLKKLTTEMRARVDELEIEEDDEEDDDDEEDEDEDEDDEDDAAAASEVQP